MRQLVFRIFDPKVPVIQVILGNVLDKEFLPETENLSGKLIDLLGDAANCIHFDDYFGNTPFIKASDFSEVFSFAMPLADRVELFPGLLVLTLNPDSYGTKEED